MKEAKVDLSCHAYVTREASSDEWDRDDTAKDWTIPDYFTIVKEYGDVRLNFDPKPHTPYYMVYYIWSTGDSFGHDEQYGCEVHGIYETKEEAVKERDRLSKVTDYSVPWNGYFESLDSVHVARFMVK